MPNWMSDAEFKISNQIRQEFGDSKEVTQITDFIFNLLSDANKKIREDERKSIVARLKSLGEGRMEYVHNRDPKTGDEIEAMGGIQGMIYGEAKGAVWLSKIIDGESDKGWLPSWLWKG